MGIDDEFRTETETGRARVAELTALAEEYEASAKLLTGARRQLVRRTANALRAHVARLTQEIDIVEGLRAGIERLRDELPLTDVDSDGTVRAMTPAHRAELSKAHTKRRRGMRHDLYQQVGPGKRFPSLRSLATAIPMDVGFLSRILAGRQPMPADKAMRIEVLTGYPRDKWQR